jgi:hypothetical protein
MKKMIVLAVLVGASALAVTGIALADHSPPDGPAVEPTFIEGNPSCEGALKIDPVASRTYSTTFRGFAGSITITVVQTAMGPTFTFVTDHPSHLVTSVIVKGGPNALMYNYGAGIAHDDGLHSPLNPNNPNNKWYGLSHLCFATDKK